MYHYLRIARGREADFMPNSLYLIRSIRIVLYQYQLNLGIRVTIICIPLCADEHMFALKEIRGYAL